MKKNQTIHITVSLIFLLIFCTSAYAQKVKELSPENVVDAMRKSSDYMVNEVSTHGGYLLYYSEDFSERQGEAPGRESQIMVQGGTPEMGHLFLDMFDATDDRAYLEYAKKVAYALIYGQHKLGGWHYFIDFDHRGLETYYEEVSSQFILGMEEYRHYYGNCTYDDNATQGATTYLLRIYMKTLLPEYLAPLKKALEFMLISQYPNGGWPQRYPLRYEFVHDGLPDYTSMYTLNDNAMSNTISVLLDAYEQLGDERYLEAARRGGDFFMISQGPVGQAGWAEQYDMNLQPCWARTHEPPGFMPRQTLNTIRTLEQLYLFTGDQRYLRPIPAALDWLEKSGLRVLDNGSIEAARLYEPGTNLPIKVDLMEERNDHGYHLYDFYSVDTETYLKARANSANTNHAVIKQVQGGLYTYKLEPVINQYEKIDAASAEEHKALYNELFRPKKRKIQTPTTGEVAQIIHAMNEQGAWIEDVKIWDYTPGQLVESRKTVRGISVGTYIQHMRLFMKYISTY
jgi:PelA/Pel-15E family pectate lyase